MKFPNANEICLIAILCFVFLDLPWEATATTVKATASVNIVAPLAVFKSSDIAFGSIGQGSNGTIVLSHLGERTASGPNILDSKVSAATFTVSGLGQSSFFVQLPGSMEVSEGRNAMAVDDFISNLPGNIGLVDEGGTKVSLGATLHVKKDQPEGNYSGYVPITIMYN